MFERSIRITDISDKILYSINISGLKIKPNPMNTPPAKTFKVVFLVFSLFLRNKVNIKKGINVVPKKISINIIVGRFVIININTMAIGIILARKCFSYVILSIIFSKWIILNQNGKKMMRILILRSKLEIPVLTINIIEMILTIFSIPMKIKNISQENKSL